MDLELKGSPVRAEFKGKSLGDSYTYDILDRKKFKATVGLMVQASLLPS
jgi:hypothetical protein